MAKILFINPIGEGRAKPRAKRKSGAAKRPTNRRKKPVKTVKRPPMAKAKKRRSKRKSVRTKRAVRRPAVKSASRPRRKTRKSKSRSVVTYRANPIAKRRSKRRHNPIGGLPSLKHIKNNLVMPSLTGAAGALLLDVAWANLPIPASMKSGYVGHGVKLLGAIALGTLAGKVVNKQAAENATVGMITIQAYNLGKQFLAMNVPALKLAGDDMGWIEAGYPLETDVGEYISEYISGDENNVVMHGDEDSYDDGEEDMGEYISENGDLYG